MRRVTRLLRAAATGAAVMIVAYSADRGPAADLDRRAAIALA